MKRLIVLAMVILIVATCNTAVAATKSGLNSFSIGNSNAGANGSYSMVTQNSTGFSSAQLKATGNVMLLGKTVKGVEFSTTTVNSSGSKTSTYALTIGGYTVDSGVKTVTFTWNKPINCTLVQVIATITVGAVPVTVKGSVGASGNIGYAMQFSTTGVGLSGSASAWATGTASAGVGVPLLNLSLKSDLQLLKTSLLASVQVTPTTFSGNASLRRDPLSIAFSIVLQSMKKTWYQMDLANYSYPSQTITLIQL